MTRSGTVAVTGGGAGLGLGLVAEFARRGRKVMALAYDESQRAGFEEATAGLSGAAEFIVLDVTKPGDFAFPDDIDILINNAGIRLKNYPIEKIDMDEWRHYFDVNFFGLVDMTKRALPLMKARGTGIICNVSSSSVFHPLPFLGPYRSTKGAVCAFSETLRMEVEQFGIRVIEFLPGAVRTGMNVESTTRIIAQAVEFPDYAAMAHKHFERGQASGIKIIEIEEAANYMVDAIEAPYTRMRYGSDVPSTEMMDGWRKDGGEAGIAAMIAALTP